MSPKGGGEPVSRPFVLKVSPQKIPQEKNTTENTTSSLRDSILKGGHYTGGGEILC